MAENKKREGRLQSKEKETEKERIISLVSEDATRRDQAFSFFRGSNLHTYTDVSLGQFIGYRTKPPWKKDYQYNLFDPITRDKVYAILSKSAGMFEAQFFNTNKRQERYSNLIASTLEAFYKDSTRQLKEVDQNKLTMLAALITPKTIWFEGWRHRRRTVRDITGRDPITGQITETTERKIVHYNGPYGELIPVTDFYPSSMKQRNLQEQDRCSWVRKMSKAEFQREYPTSRYPAAANAMSHGEVMANDLSEFSIRTDLKNDEIEVIHTFEKWEDRHSIIGGLQLLTEVNSPMPYAHKDYPFVWGGFEVLNPWFIYDMPLPIKILDMQDMSNEVLNLTLDMVWRALNETWLSKEGDEINDDELYGGGVVPVNNPTNFQKLEFGSGFGFQAASSMIDRARKSIESSSIDAVSSGSSGSRPNVTAQEVSVAREAALEITTLFLQNMEAMEAEKARLRTLNQLDRYHRPIDWQRHIGEEDAEEAIAMFREISVRDAKLSNGERGKINIFITESPRGEEDLKEANDQIGEMSETIDLSPEFIREVQFDVEIVANSSVKRSKRQEVAEARAFYLDALANPQVFNVPEAARDYVKKLGKDEKKVLNGQEKKPQAPAPEEGDQGIPKPPGEFDDNAIESVLNDL